MTDVSSTCHHCGVSFELPARHARRGRGQFCSRRCKGLASRIPLPVRFWSRVEKTDGCWIWTGGATPKGYGLLKVENRVMQIAHRVSWAMANGPIPAGMMVCHRCDNPPCVRPDHLYLGTARDNNREAIAKGRRPQNTTEIARLRQQRSGA